MSAILTFELNTPAVQLVESTTRPGATLKISGVDMGTAYTKTQYFATQAVSGAYIADNDSTVDFVINYLVLVASGKGNGIGKITGSATIDAVGNVTVNATDVVGNTVAYTVDVSGSERTIKLTNPATTSTVEYTTTNTRYRIVPTPNDADVELFDSRDASIVPPAAIMAGTIQYALPVLNTVNIPNDINYVVSRDTFVTATGKFTVTRTGSASSNNSVTYSTDGNEASHSWNGTANPRLLSITLESIATEYDISFAASTINPSTASATLNGVDLVPEQNGHFLIPFVAADTQLFYKIEAQDYHTVNGILLLKPDGSVEDQTPQSEIDGTITYQYDPSLSQVNVQMMPSLTIVPTSPTTAVVPVGFMMPESFSRLLNIFGDRLQNGKMEFVNDTDNDYEIIGVEIVGRPTLAHNVFRTINGANEPLATPSLMFSRLRDVVDLANAKYPTENFADYYEYLLYYYKNIYVPTAGVDYSGITSLEQLDPRDMGVIWAGNVWFDSDHFDGTQADFDAGRVYTVAGPTYSLIEEDVRVAALAEKLIAEYAFNFTFDNVKAGPIPISVPEMTPQNKGLQFYDYENHTPENLVHVKNMFDFVIEKHSAVVFDKIAMSTNGSYAHNGYVNNKLDFGFEINLIVKLREPSYAYVVKFYRENVTTENLLGEQTGTPSYTLGYRLTHSDVARDLGANWLNNLRPAGFSGGMVVGNYPEITLTFDDNVVTVLYLRSACVPSVRMSNCRKDIRGQKIWVDDDNVGQTRPESVEITLLRDGVAYQTATVRSNGDGRFVFPCVITWRNADEQYEYTVDELTVPAGYTVTVDDTNITNTLI